MDCKKRFQWIVKKNFINVFEWIGRLHQRWIRPRFPVDSLWLFFPIEKIILQQTAAATFITPPPQLPFWNWDLNPGNCLDADCIWPAPRLDVEGGEDPPQVRLDAPLLQEEGELVALTSEEEILTFSDFQVRYRRDGYCWKKRKDGKTTREDHMKLKVQGMEVTPKQTFPYTSFPPSMLFLHPGHWGEARRGGFSISLLFHPAVLEPLTRRPRGENV